MDFLDFLAILAAFVGPIIFIIMLGNFIGWCRTGRPWNWRVLIWADLYYRWLDRHNRDQGARDEHEAESSANDAPPRGEP